MTDQTEAARVSDSDVRNTQRAFLQLTVDASPRAMRRLRQLFVRGDLEHIQLKSGICRVRGTAVPTGWELAVGTWSAFAGRVRSDWPGLKDVSGLRPFWRMPVAECVRRLDAKSLAAGALRPDSGKTGPADSDPAGNLEALYGVASLASNLCERLYRTSVDLPRLRKKRVRDRTVVVLRSLAIGLFLCDRAWAMWVDSPNAKQFLDVGERFLEFALRRVLDPRSRDGYFRDASVQLKLPFVDENRLSDSRERFAAYAATGERRALTNAHRTMLDSLSSDTHPNESVAI